MSSLDFSPALRNGLKKSNRVPYSTPVLDSVTNLVPFDDALSSMQDTIPFISSVPAINASYKFFLKGTSLSSDASLGRIGYMISADRDNSYFNLQTYIIPNVSGVTQTSFDRVSGTGVSSNIEIKYIDQPDMADMEKARFITVPGIGEIVLMQANYLAHVTDFCIADSNSTCMTAETCARVGNRVAFANLDSQGSYSTSDEWTEIVDAWRYSDNNKQITSDSDIFSGSSQLNRAVIWSSESGSDFDYPFIDICGVMGWLSESGNKTWANVKEAVLTLVHTGQLNMALMSWRGEIYDIRGLGDNLVVYGSGGVTMLSFDGSRREILRYGVGGKSFISTNDSTHFFIDVDNILWRLDAQGQLTKIATLGVGQEVFYNCNWFDELENLWCFGKRNVATTLTLSVDSDNRLGKPHYATVGMYVGDEGNIYAPAIPTGVDLVLIDDGSGVNWVVSNTSRNSIVTATAATADFVLAGFNPTVGKVYRADFTVELNVGGSVIVKVGGASGPSVSGSGNHTQYFTATDTTEVTFVPTSLTGVINSFTIKEVNYIIKTYPFSFPESKFNTIVGVFMDGHYGRDYTVQDLDASCTLYQMRNTGDVFSGAPATGTFDGSGVARVRATCKTFYLEITIEGKEETVAASRSSVLELTVDRLEVLLADGQKISIKEAIS